MEFFIKILIAYLIGSIPMGYILVKLIKGEDIRIFGSGNIGATNVGRVLGFKYFIIVFLLDALKGAFPITINILFFKEKLAYRLILIGIATFIGNLFPVYLKFKGGKGVATSIGVLLPLFYKEIGIVFLCGVILIAVFKMVSLASIISSLLFPFMVYFFENKNPDFIHLQIFSIIISFFIVYRHISNIKKLLDGTERKIGEKLENIN